MRYLREEVRSCHGYTKAYKVKEIGEQVKILRQFFPEVDSVNEKIAERLIPRGAEGWFAFPRWQMISQTYGEAVEKVFAIIGSKRKFDCEKMFGIIEPGRKFNGKFRLNRLQQHVKTAKMFQKIGYQQKNCDILVVPCQFGLRHTGRSIRRAREVFAANEFGLGAYEVGIMLLTHPERLVGYNDLWIDCAGDKFSNYTDSRIACFTYYSTNIGLIGIVAVWPYNVCDHRGSASAFF